MHLDVEKQWQFFKSKYNELIDKYVPKRKFPADPVDQSKRTGSYNREITLSVKKKHRLWQRYIETRDGQKYLAYVQARNKAKALIRQHQRDTCKRIARAAKVNPKRFWSYVNSKTRIKNDIPNLFKGPLPDGSQDLTNSTQEKAEALSDFFSSVFTQEPQEDFDEPALRSTDHPMTDIDFNQLIIEKRLSKLNTAKSVHPRILKEMRSAISLPLSLLFSTSYTTGTVPDDWKKANVTAIHKKDDKRKPENYRPISLTSVVCKVMEGIISDALVGHMKANKFFTNKQFGFLKGRSAALQLLNVLDEWTKILLMSSTLISRGHLTLFRIVVWGQNASLMEFVGMYWLGSNRF